MDIMLYPLILLAATLFPFPEASIQTAFDGQKGALVVIDCASGETERFNPEGCGEKLPPCSTFKIWNTAIGLELGVISQADQPFYKWDGEKRFIDAWNKDLTLREAFAASCVPAYQELARKIGMERMNTWIEKIHYGDRNTSSGIDVFWLPAPDRKPILISPDEQARLIASLVGGKLPFSTKTLSTLKDIMTAKRTDHGTLYGKTGTGTIGSEDYNIGWYVGYVESSGKTFAFACVVKGEKVMGKDARTIVERILTKQSLL